MASDRSGHARKVPAHLSAPTGRLVPLRPIEPPEPEGEPGSAPLGLLSQSSLEAIFPPIADYAFLSDCENTCLVSPTGAVEWLCLPRPHDPSVFGTILDRAAGSFRLAPADTAVPANRRYVPGTMVLATTWQTRTGWLAVRDFLAIGALAPHARPLVAPPPHPGGLRRHPRARPLGHVSSRLRSTWSSTASRPSTTAGSTPDGSTPTPPTSRVITTNPDFSRSPWPATCGSASRAGRSAPATASPRASPALSP